MNVSDAILKRTSIRKWKKVPVEREKIEKILEAGRRAPCYRQHSQANAVRHSCGKFRGAGVSNRGLDNWQLDSQ